MTSLRNILVNKISCKSIWFMRQAGRYLPEFREIRKKNKNFIKLCLNSELSSEITLQPIKRFNLDSAIIFSDILMVPWALGQRVNFKKDYGPQVDEFNMDLLLNNNEKEFSKRLYPVYRAIEITRKKLEKEKSLISFIGAPWTLLVYMLSVKKDKRNLNFSKLNKNFDIEEIFKELIKYLKIHIKNQISAGADVVQIFDSWAGLIPEENFKKFCIIPTLNLIDFCKEEKIQSICFPKGIKEKYEEFNNSVKPDGINIDSEIDPSWAKDKLKNVVIQGGLDPRILLKTDDEIFKGATKYIKAFKGMPYVFNLGHGLLPETDPAKVEKLINFYRSS